MSLAVDGRLEPAFDPEHMQYTLHLSAWQPELRLTPTATADAEIRLQPSGTRLSSGTEHTLPLDGPQIQLSVGPSSDPTVYSFDVAQAGVSTHALQSGSPLAGDEFGQSIALNGPGTRLLVGAPQAGEPFVDRGYEVVGAGRAHVYERMAGEWSQVAELRASSGGTALQFGHSVAMDDVGDVVVVGARLDGPEGDAGPPTQTGAVYVFVRDGLGFREVQKLTPNVAPVGTFFGQDLALSGDGRTLLVGGGAATGMLGTVHVYVRDGEGFRRWEGPAQRYSAGPVHSLALDRTGSVVAIGVAGHDQPSPSGRPRVGAVDIYLRDSDGLRFGQTLLAEEPRARAGFGTSVGLSPDGRTLAASSEVFATESLCGTSVPRFDVHVFERSADEFALRDSFLRLGGEGPLNLQSGDLAFDGSGTRFVATALNYQDEVHTPFDAPHATDDERGTAFLFARGAAGWRAVGATKVHHPRHGTYGSSVALDDAAGLLVVGSARFGYAGDDRAPSDASELPQPSGWVWTHTLDAPASAPPLSAPGAPAAAMALDCELPGPPPGLPDEVCWNGGAHPSSQASYCPASTCVPGVLDLRVDVSAGAQFVCATEPSCTTLPADFDYRNPDDVSLELTHGELTVELGFDQRLLADGYSVENFRRFLTHAVARFETALDTGYDARSVAVAFGLSSTTLYPAQGIQFDAYDDGVLTLRIAAPWTGARYTREIPPYLCPALGGVTTCDDVECSYGAGPQAESAAWVEIEVRASIVPPAEE